MIERVNFQGDVYKVICKIPNNQVNNRKLKLDFDADIVLQNKTHHYVLEKIIEGEFGDFINTHKEDYEYFALFRVDDSDFDVELALKYYKLFL